MGLFWDLMQQSQIAGQEERASSLEGRVEALERQAAETHQLLRRLIERLEEHLGEDVDGDGQVG